MDKAITSTAHRLLREKIQFTKASGDLNISEQYKQSGLVISLFIHYSLQIYNTRTKWWSKSTGTIKQNEGTNQAA